MKQRWTTDQFVKEAVRLHGDRYDYSWTNYMNMHTPVSIICRQHGCFKQEPNVHIRCKSGCPLCAKNLKDTPASFKAKALKVHGERYDYTGIKQIHSQSKVEIKCHIHGPFLQVPASHLRGHGCPHCAGIIKKTTKEFITQAGKIHGKRYGYSKAVYKGRHSPITIICRKHGVFSQIAGDHLRGKGCIKCKRSVGEKRIATLLLSNSITSIQEYKFKSCLSPKGSPLPFDFYLPDYRICLEYDGRQHEEGWPGNGGHSKERIQLHDRIRTEYCNNNGYRLLRINYRDFDRIDKVLLPWLEANGVTLRANS